GIPLAPLSHRGGWACSTPGLLKGACTKSLHVCATAGGAETMGRMKIWMATAVVALWAFDSSSAQVSGEADLDTRARANVPGAADVDIAAQAEARVNRADNGWRYRQHNGRWWYWQGNRGDGRWLMWDNGRWYDY